MDDIHTGSGIDIGSEEDPFGWGYFDGFRPRCEDSVEEPELEATQNTVQHTIPDVPPIPTSPINTNTE